MEIKMLERNKIKTMWKKENPHYFKSDYVPTKVMVWFYRGLLAIAGKTIEIETDYLFSDQFNTGPIPNVSENGMRIMECYVAEVFDDERPGKARCEWCGEVSWDTFKCVHCDSKEYLTVF